MDIMTDPSARVAPTGDAPVASRRNIGAAAVTMAAAAGTASGARGQTQSSLRLSNPPGMSSPPTYSHVVAVNGPHCAVYIAGQTGADASGKVAQGFRAQALQAMENLKTALATLIARNGIDVGRSSSTWTATSVTAEPG
jgi:enamine deaminase RidA (YjgF/YER057c/UK114 family)